jgi:hypothetical protein
MSAVGEKYRVDQDGVMLRYLLAAISASLRFG